MGFSTHSFDVSLQEAKLIQEDLRKRVILHDLEPGIGNARIVGGADVAFLTLPDHQGTPGGIETRGIDSEQPVSRGFFSRSQIRATHALAGIVVLDSESGEIIETAHALTPVTMPYIPGYLSFREGPAIIAALGELSCRPEVMMYDGCGIAHPRGFGLASHMAVLTGIPSVGCAKSRLCGSCDEPGGSRGAWTEIVFHDVVVGSCVRTRTNVKPVFVSPGSGISLESSRNLVLRLAVKYRLPETTRLAHQLVSRKKIESG